MYCCDKTTDGLLSMSERLCKARPERVTTSKVSGEKTKNRKATCVILKTTQSATGDRKKVRFRKE